jgi:quercetin dioxygenase-like cupin family protein
MYVSREEALRFRLGPGIDSRILGRGGSMMVVENRFEKGVVVPDHDHEHEQCGYVVSGVFDFNIGGEKRTLKAGESFYAPPGVPHGCTVVEEGVVLDIFTPQREDFFEKADRS